MSDLRKAFSEDLRRFGLVLLGAGILTDVPAAARILAISGGFFLLLGAYIVVGTKGETE